MTPTLDITTDLDTLRAWWNSPAHHDFPFTDRMFAIAGTEHDQVVPDGIHNPYWELVRYLPSTSMDMAWDGVTPYGFGRGLEAVSRDRLAHRFSWAIPSPGDLGTLVRILDGRGLVEVGAGAGYWAWQAEQYGVDVVAYDPTDPADNTFTAGVEYTTVLRDDWQAAARHPDRALFLCWPSYAAPWGRLALEAYTGDLVVYVGEGDGGCCADADFFEVLHAGWERLDGTSGAHRTWWGIHCQMTAYRRVAQS